MKLSAPIAKKLSAYSLFAGTLFALDKSDAQIIYTDLIPDDTLNTDELFLIDLDNDGTPEFQITNLYSSQQSKRAFGIGCACGYGQFGLITLTNSTSTFPHAFNSQDSICSSDDNLVWIALTSGAILATHSGNMYGDFAFADTDKYVGVTPNLNGNNNMGWIRLDVAPDASYIIIKDYAYNTQLNCLLAGETTPLSVNSKDDLKLEIFPNPTDKTLFLSGLSKDFKGVQVFLFDLYGKKLLTQRVSSVQNEIDVSALASGIYLLELKNAEDIIVKKFEVKR